MYRRHSKEFKKGIVRLYQAGAPLEWIAREKGIDKHLVKIWIGRYKLGKALELKRGKGVDKRVKKAVKEAVKEGLSTDKASIIYDISRGTVQKWKREINEEEEEGKEYRRVRSGERVFEEGELGIKDSSSGKKNARRREVAAGIEGLRKEYPLKELLKRTELSRSTYYYHRKRLQGIDKYGVVKERIVQIHTQHRGRYGYRRITEQLRREGFNNNHKQVLKLMKEMGLKSVVKKVRYRSYRGEVGQKAPDLIKRHFRAKGPNEKWATDITQVEIEGDKLYVSPIQDMFNGEIVSYSVSRHPDLELVKQMVSKACHKAGKTKGIILHSDQGWHYQHYVYHKILREQGMIASMSRKGNCLDNAKMESFFGTLKKELLYANKYESIETFKKDLIEYIAYYNNERIRLDLNGLSPVQYRAQWQEQHTNL